jgi:hypothetical protein
MKPVFAIVGLLLIIGVPFWFATRPFKDPKKRLDIDNLTNDRADPNSQNLD